MGNAIHDKSRKDTIDIIIRELAIPFLGSLVPGIYVWMGILFSIVPPVSLLIGSFVTPNSNTTFNLLTYLSTFVQNTKSGSWILFLVISYVFGAILSKQDPKVTDQESFKRISRRCSPNREDMENNFACTSLTDCEYPYPYLSNYLKKRGLFHLLDYVHWEKNPDAKSKAYINKLKIDIELSSADAYQNLLRNEAHIRLSNTVWHSANLLRYSCIFGLSVVIIAIILGLQNAPNNSINEILRYSLGSAAFPLFIIMLSEYFRVNIENYFHFQRLRELFYILETYHKVSFEEKVTEQLDRGTCDKRPIGKDANANGVDL